MKLLTDSGGHWQVLPLPTQGLVAVLKGIPDQCSKSWNLIAVLAHTGSQQRLFLAMFHPHPVLPQHSLRPVHSCSFSVYPWAVAPPQLPLCSSGWVLWDDAVLGRAITVGPWLGWPHPTVAPAHLSWVSRTHSEVCARQNRHSYKAGKSTTIAMLKYLKNPNFYFKGPRF